MNRSIPMLFRIATVVAGICPMLWSQTPAVRFTVLEQAHSSTARGRLMLSRVTSSPDLTITCGIPTPRILALADDNRRSSDGRTH